MGLTPVSRQFAAAAGSVALVWAFSRCVIRTCHGVRLQRGPPFLSLRMQRRAFLTTVAAASEGGSIDVNRAADGRRSISECHPLLATLVHWNEYIRRVLPFPVALQTFVLLQVRQRVV